MDRSSAKGSRQLLTASWVVTEGKLRSQVMLLGGPRSLPTSEGPPLGRLTRKLAATWPNDDAREASVKLLRSLTVWAPVSCMMRSPSFCLRHTLL